MPKYEPHQSFQEHTALRAPVPLAGDHHPGADAHRLPDGAGQRHRARPHRGRDQCADRHGLHLGPGRPHPDHHQHRAAGQGTAVRADHLRAELLRRADAYLRVARPLAERHREGAYLQDGLFQHGRERDGQAPGPYRPGRQQSVAHGAELLHRPAAAVHERPAGADPDVRGERVRGPGGTRHRAGVFLDYLPAGPPAQRLAPRDALAPGNQEPGHQEHHRLDQRHQEFQPREDRGAEAAGHPEPGYG